MNNSRSKLIAACFLLTVGFNVDFCFAADPADPLSKLMDNAVAQYRPVTDDSLAQGRAALSKDVDSLRGLLSLTPENVPGWER